MLFLLIYRNTNVYGSHVYLQGLESKLNAMDTNVSNREVSVVRNEPALMLGGVAHFSVGVASG